MSNLAIVIWAIGILIIIAVVIAGIYFLNRSKKQESYVKVLVISQEGILKNIFKVRADDEQEYILGIISNEALYEFPFGTTLVLDKGRLPKTGCGAIRVEDLIEIQYADIA